MRHLSGAQHRFFYDNGFLAIPAFFTEDEIAAASGAYQRVWEELPPDVIVDSEATGRRVLIKDLTDEERQLPFKVNDLYLRDENLRAAVMSARLGAGLRELFEGCPVIVNTLSVEYGTQQAEPSRHIVYDAAHAGTPASQLDGIGRRRRRPAPLLPREQPHRALPFRGRRLP